MRSITAGLCLSLIGGVALAQTPSAPASLSKLPAAQPMSANPPQPSPAPGPQAGSAAPAGPPEGELVETPNGFFLLRPGQGPTPVGIRPPPGAMAPDGMSPRSMSPGGMPPRDMAEDQGESSPPPPRQPHRRPEGKGARFRIQTPSMTVGVKCPDDEAIEACVDAVSGLLDKVRAQPHP